MTESAGRQREPEKFLLRVVGDGPYLWSDRSATSCMLELHCTRRYVWMRLRVDNDTRPVMKKGGHHESPRASSGQRRLLTFSIPSYPGHFSDLTKGIFAHRLPR